MLYIFAKIIERKNSKDTQNSSKGEDAYAVEYINKRISLRIWLLMLNTRTSS